VQPVSVLASAITGAASAPAMAMRREIVMSNAPLSPGEPSTSGQSAAMALVRGGLTHSYRGMTDNDLKPSRDIAVLLEVMKRLRDGCPWDKVQTFDTIAPYTIEEAYEVASAIADKDMKALPGELGDLLFQVVFHARMAEEAGLFDFGDVVEAVTAKMIRRHPHVFGDEEAKTTAVAPKDFWEKLKESERTAAGQVSLLDDVASALPALTRAEKLQRRASTVGFDWNNAHLVLDKLAEEAREILDAPARPSARKRSATCCLWSPTWRVT
jgi:MazG family protein